MIAIASLAQIPDSGLLAAENKILINKEDCRIENSRIEFNGKNNVLVVEDGLIIKNSKIRFAGDSGLVVLRKSRFPLYLNLTTYSQSCVYIGRESYLNGTLNIISSEANHILIGDFCLFSFGIWIRNSDAHPIFDETSKLRINPGKTIVVGDHVWIGQNSLMLKGCQIGSGSVVGAASCISNKVVGCNEIWAGNPARKLKSNIVWQGNCVHSLINHNIALSDEGANKYYFDKDEKMSIFLDFLKMQSLEDKLRYMYCFDMIRCNYL